MEFHPIASYGFIGNLGSCALVGKNGSIDWCCLPKLDSPSIFAAILDPERGGSFSVAPEGSYDHSTQAYLPDTNVLRTTFTCRSGVLELTDWMHMSNFSFEEQEEHSIPVLYRLARCVTGSVRCRILFDPRPDYGRGQTTLSSIPEGLTAKGSNDTLRLYAPCSFVISANGAESVKAMHAGDELALFCAYGSMERRDIPSPHRSLDRTINFWSRWVIGRGEQNIRLPTLWRDQVTRSTLALKILAGGKGIAAAATTSLPEILGKGSNWDYRFSWIRDTCLTIRALTATGHLNDAREFFEWITDMLVTSGQRPADLSVMVPLHGTSLQTEEELTHLRGYCDSRPVRIGNAASTQNQHDIYGEILEAVFRSEHLQPTPDSALVRVLCEIVNYVCTIWRLPDHGIWELRTERKQYVHSKVMCWVALDRGIRLAEKHGWHTDITRWKEERAMIHATVMEQGYNKKRQSFVQAFGSDILDATALLFPVLNFLPANHPYALSTLQAVQRELADGALVYRSSAHHRKEGAFGICSFWLVDALALAGKTEEARRHFDDLLRYGSHLGLYSEEIDPATGAFLGNFPQAFTHVGLINSALYLSRLPASTSPAEKIHS